MPPTQVTLKEYQALLSWSQLTRSGVHLSAHHPHWVQGQFALPGVSAMCPVVQSRDPVGDAPPPPPGLLFTPGLGRHVGQTHGWAFFMVTSIRSPHQPGQFWCWRLAIPDRSVGHDLLLVTFYVLQDYIGPILPRVHTGARCAKRIAWPQSAWSQKFLGKDIFYYYKWQNEKKNN